MLFEEEKIEIKKPDVRPELPKGTKVDYEVGFLFNFVSGKSTRFDLEPVLIYKEPRLEYKRISLQSEIALAYLQPLSNETYFDFYQFSDNKLLDWMSRTGNRFLRNHSGTWAHVSAKELVNLRKHYRDLLEKMWPTLSDWPNLFALKIGRFSNTQQQNITLSKNPPQFRFSVEQRAKMIVLKMTLVLDGREAIPNLVGGFLLEHNNKLYLPKDASELAIIDLFKNGALTFPLSVKREITKKYILQWLDKYEVTIDEKLNIERSTPEVKHRVMLSELNESNLMIRPE
jgi:hypothetical protein